MALVPSKRIFKFLFGSLRRTLASVFMFAVVAGGVWYAGRSSQKRELISVRRGEIVQEVDVTGQITPAERVDLAFERSGKIGGIRADVGDQVNAGETLVYLENADAAAGLAQAEANVQAEQANLNALLRGTRPEQIQINQAKAAGAEASRDDNRRALVDALNDAYTKSDDAVRNKVDQFMSNPRGSNPKLNFTLSDSSLQLQIENTRASLEPVFSSWSAMLGGLNSGSDDSILLQTASTSRFNLDRVKSFLENAAFGLSTLSSSASLSQSTLDNWRSAVSTARTNVNTAISNLSAAVEDLKTAASNLIVAQKQLDLDKAGPTKEEIEAQKAKVAQAAAAAASQRADFSKTILAAPFRGLVTKQDAKVGEIVAANVPLVSLMTESQFEIEANVPEVDVGKIKVGDGAAITLDAFPNETFTGRVAKIDPAETIIDGVVNFKVTVLFDKADLRLKSGLTANLAVETLRKSDVLILPEFAVVEKDIGSFVEKFDNGKVVEVPVTVGIRGRDGLVEIISGLGQGDQVQKVGLRSDSNQ